MRKRHRWIDKRRHRKALRLRAVVVLSFVDFLAQEEVGYRLCITPRTVYSDLQQVYVLVEGAKR
jgi:hypothetical protein